MKENHQNVEAIIARVLGVDIKTLSDKSGPAHIPEWDSFNALMLIAEFEKEFQTEFSLDEVSDIKTIADIKALLRARALLV